MVYRVPTQYLVSIQEHTNECEADIDRLREHLKAHPWGRFEELAAERTLQTLIEAAIGIAKHWCKAETGHVATEALQAFKRLQAERLIEESDDWRRMVGLRNALVHDYLDIDDGVIRSVIEDGHYLRPLLFIRTAIKALS